MADKKISALTAASTPLAGTEVLPIVQGGSTVKVSVENVLVSAQPSGTANTVAYLNGSKQLSYSSNLAFDGSSFTFGVGGGAKLIAFNSQTIASINTGGSAYTDMLFDANDLIVRTGVGGATESLRVSDAGNVTAARGNLVIGTAGKGIDFSANGGDVLTQYDEGTWTPSQGAGLTVVGAFSSRGYFTRVGRMVQVTGTVLGSTSVAVAAGTILCGNLPFASSSSQGSAGSMINDTINASGVIFTSINNVYATNSIAATPAIAFTVTYFI
jgi:hypothetical protein